MKVYICDIHGGIWQDRFQSCNMRHLDYDSCLARVFVRYEPDIRGIDEKLLKRFVDRWDARTDSHFAYDELSELVRLAKLHLTGNFEGTQDDRPLVVEPDRKRRGGGKPVGRNRGR